MTLWRLLPYLAALVVGVSAGAIVNSPIVAGLGALVFAGVWMYSDHSARPP
jgi:hypothetical protein